MPIVVSASNDRLRWVRKLMADRRARHKEGLWVVDGVRLAEEVLREGLPVRLWILEEGWGAAPGREGDLRRSAEERGDEIVEVKRGLLREVADTQTPQGVVVAFQAPQWSPSQVLAGPGPVVALDRLQDPGNLGTIARTVEGAGASGLLLNPGCVDPGNPKALRASAGALLRTPIAHVSDLLVVLRDSGRPILAAVGHEGMPYDREDLGRSWALLLGQEGNGVAPELQRGADRLLTVPMHGRLESLNVATTAAVLLFEAARQRRIKLSAPSSAELST